MLAVVVDNPPLINPVTVVTPTTSTVRLLTAPGTKLGVWIERTKVHGILIGTGNNRPQLNFLDKTPDARLGDVVSTSPVSTIMPPNLPVGVIQFINAQNLPSPYGFVQLLASPEAIDWVRVQRSNENS